MEFPGLEGIEHKYVVTDLGVRLHCVVMGTGPPLLLLHGFPDFWYSFRFQIPALAAAGFTVIVPDTRGSGESDVPKSSDKNTLFDFVGDIVSVLKALHITEKIFVVGHDWGSQFAGHLVRLRPDLVRSVVYLGFMPFTWKAQLNFAEDLVAALGEDVYINVFQEPGRVEALFAKSKTTYVLKAFLTRWHEDLKVGVPKVYSDDEEAKRPLPEWLTPADLQYYADTFDKTGFTGSLNTYRCLKRSTELAEAWGDKPLEAPSLFVKCTREIQFPFQRNLNRAEILANNIGLVPNLQDVIFVDGGHFFHQEKHEEVNKVIIDYFNSFLTS